MYWLPKIHKTPIGARLAIASKNYSTEPLSDVISIVFKMIFNHVETFHRKSLFYICFKKILCCWKFISNCCKIEWNKYQEKKVFQFSTWPRYARRNTRLFNIKLSAIQISVIFSLDSSYATITYWRKVTILLDFSYT